MYQNIIVLFVVVIAVIFFVKIMIKKVQKGGCGCSSGNKCESGEAHKNCDSCCSNCPFAKKSTPRPERQNSKTLKRAKRIKRRS